MNTLFKMDWSLAPKNVGYRLLVGPNTRRN